MINTISIKEALKTTGVVAINPKGQSMYPYVKNTDTIIVVRPPEKLKKYDCILFFERENVYVLHRLLKIEGDRLLTMGDNNLTFDRPVKSGDVVGVLQGFYRGKRYVEVLDKRISLWVKIGCLRPVKVLRIYFYRLIFRIKARFSPEREK